MLTSYCRLLSRFRNRLMGTASLLLIAGLTEVTAQYGILHFDNYTQDNGLPNNLVHCIYQDQGGWIWFGTSQGLCRFDGYQFMNFKNDPDNPRSLRGDLVRVIFEDSHGTLWIGTEGGGLNLFDRNNEDFVHFTADSGDPSGLSGNTVNAIVEAPDGGLWIGTDAGLQHFDLRTHQADRSLKVSDAGLSDNFIRSLLMDRNGSLWIGTANGLDFIEKSKGSVQHITLPDGRKGTDDIYEIMRTSDGTIWVGGYTTGLYEIPAGQTIARKIRLDPTNDRSLTVRSIVADSSGVLWIGTRGGLYLYSPRSGMLEHYVHREFEQESLCNNSILDLFSDRKGDLWIGTRGGMSKMSSEKQRFDLFKVHPDIKNSLNDNEIYCFHETEKQELWIGTERGGINILNRKTGKFTALMRQSGTGNSLSVNCIKAFLDDQKGNIWIGTYLGGINIYNKATGKISFLQHNPSDPSSLCDNRIWSLFLDSKGKIWVGTEEGLDRIDPETRKPEHFKGFQGKQVLWISEDKGHQLWIGSDKVYVFDPEKKQTRSLNAHTRDFCQDSKGRIWLASFQKGLGLFEPTTGTITYYNEKAGLPNDQCLCIREDSDGFLWISTANGLSRFDPEDKKFLNFDKDDGLQNNQFNYGAALRLSTGEMAFGGIGGFNIFQPHQVKTNHYLPPVVFTELKIDNHKVQPSSASDAILHVSLSQTKQLVIPYSRNVITLEFAALDYTRSQKNLYQYYLKGFDKNWSEPGFQRTIQYTNLDPGNYVFKVRASNNDQVWNPKEATMAIKILPPYWKTWWFKGLIVLAILAIIYFLVMFLTIRAKLRHELVFERVKAKKLYEIDLMKLRFFTNISHEIRTPLTLIMGPLEKMLHHETDAAERKNYLMIMHRNAQQLMKLINQLLDFRKLETGNLRLELKKGDLAGFVAGIAESFKELAREKSIRLRFNTVESQLFMYFDPDKIEKILNNLLSNAFKYTDKGGSITVNLSLVVDTADQLGTVKNAEEKFVELVVKDTGTGIPESSLNKIFHRFFQIPSQSTHGTGIGLALTKELVELHKGHIFVSSKPGKGSRFTVRLPFNAEPEESESTEKGIQDMDSGVISSPGEKNLAENGNILLIVEDNPDVRYFIRSNFEPEFQVYEAPDGKEGLQMALKLIPDVILADVLMPGMNGYELCRKIKKDVRTSHIPLILLTALGSKEHELEGLAAGADDYITKPFDEAILKTKVDNLFALRKLLKEKYTSEMVLKPTNVTIQSLDEKFLQKAIEVIEKNIGDPDLDIEKFAQEVGVSRMQMYRKLSALTGMTVKEFIRDIRLKRAAQMLSQKKLTVSEIAFAVGFRDLSHFRKCFKQQFGMSASEYADLEPEE